MDLSPHRPQFQEELTQIWTIKEAALKLIGKGFRFSPHRIQINFSNETLQIDQQKLFYRLNFREDHTIAVVTTELEGLRELQVLHLTRL